MSWQVSPSIEQFDIAALACTSADVRQVLAFAFGDRGGLERPQPAHLHLAGRREIRDAAREDVAEILGEGLVAFRLEVVMHELDVARADIRDGGEDAARA